MGADDPRHRGHATVADLNVVSVKELAVLRASRKMLVD